MDSYNLPSVKDVSKIAGVDEKTHNSPPVEGCPTGRGGRDTKAYLSLPYNSKLRNKARELRKAGNLTEVLLWHQ